MFKQYFKMTIPDEDSRDSEEKKGKRSIKDRERRAQRLLQKIMLQEEDGGYLSVLKRIKRAAESDEKIFAL